MKLILRPTAFINILWVGGSLLTLSFKNNPAPKRWQGVFTIDSAIIKWTKDYKLDSNDFKGKIPTNRYADSNFDALAVCASNISFTIKQIAPKRVIRAYAYFSKNNS